MFGPPQNGCDDLTKGAGFFEQSNIFLSYFKFFVKIDKLDS